MFVTEGTLIIPNQANVLPNYIFVLYVSHRYDFVLTNRTFG